MTGTQTTSRFDQAPDVPYATCTDCDVVMQTEDDGRAHMDATLEASKARRSHRISVRNRTRADRINDFIADTERDALREAADTIAAAFDRGDFTYDEALAARYCSSDLRDILQEELS